MGGERVRVVVMGREEEEARRTSTSDMNSDRLDFRSNKTNILIGHSLLEMDASDNNLCSLILQQIIKDNLCTNLYHNDGKTDVMTAVLYSKRSKSAVSLAHHRRVGL